MSVIAERNQYQQNLGNKIRKVNEAESPCKTADLGE